MMSNQQQDKSVNPTQNQQQQQPQGPKLKISYIIFGYMFINMIMTFFKTPGDPKLDKNLIGNMVNPGEKFDLEISINKNDQELYTWKEESITYDYSSENLRTNNFTLSADELFTQPYPVMTVSLTSKERDLLLYNETDIVFKKELKIQREKKNLLFDDIPGQNIIEQQRQKEDEELEQSIKSEKQYAPHYRSKIYAFFVKDDNTYNKFQMPPPFNQLEVEVIEGAKYYKPFIDTTNWWLREVDYLPQNKTLAFQKQQRYKEDKAQSDHTEDEIKELKLKAENEEHFEIEVYFDTYWSFKFMMQNQMMKSNQMYEDMGIEMGGDDTWDMLKEMLVDNSPYYLAVTMIVSTLHSLFEFLAMKNDVMFWRNLESHQGLSLRSLYTNFFMDIIILLYLIDSEETSYMILIPSFIEIFITIWKIMKTSVLRRQEKFPYVKIEPRQKVYCQTTEKFDRTAVKWMYLLLLPCFIAYLIYSLYNNEHKGWYSFIINSLVGFIYIFGFVNMTPQLYINYKLKSVDHLPWRTMIYKFLNTIVDDLFAFAISMPWLKRLSCFRDDIIFVIYIYQRWIYRVDPRRTQYGFVKDELVPTSAPPKKDTFEKEKQE